MNVYEIVTSKIISAMEKGTIPWEKEWTGSPDGAFNRVTRKPYSLLNQMMLGKSGEWASFKQWETLGGKVKKGEKASPVVFWKINRYVDKGKDGEDKLKTVPILIYYNVFHIDQIEGVEPLSDKPKTELEEDLTAESVMESYSSREQMEIKFVKGNKAFYSPLSDYVQLPERNQFKSTNGFYGVLFHELTHSTGHSSRLDRFEKGIKLASFGTADYSKEELVAEIGSAVLLNKLGLATERTERNNAAYIQSWIQVLKNDTKFIVSAASKAQKAVDYILTGKESEIETE